nr:tRNA preQ1(34) S-adenosylmethionine ribosyltransferase-isomerase QueA [Desulfobacterales bacterium]
MHLNDFDYKLPPELIAQVPVEERDQARLLLLKRSSGEIEHLCFSDLVDLLDDSFLLVLNDTRVVPARLFGKKETGGRVEVLLLQYPQDLKIGEETFTSSCLVKASKAPRIGSRIMFTPELTAKVVGIKEGVFYLDFHFSGNLEDIIKRAGNIPLPPYIKRDNKDSPPCNDEERYQTVYARKEGAVAAPTAGLHFTSDLIKRLGSKGIELAFITLHVSYGSFLPVRCTKNIEDHHVHPEWYEVTPDVARRVNQARAERKKIVAVGTTTVRTLEYAAGHHGYVKPGSGMCDLFIYPGYRFKVVDAIITNFHLPRSTLLMLVSAFAGRETILKAYQEAIDARYRFYSYGDSMMIV